MATPTGRSLSGSQAVGFLAPTATIDIPANGALVGDLIIITVSTDSGNAANWGAMSGSGWTEFMLRDAGTSAPKIRGWWKISTTAAAQSYSVTLTGANWAQVSHWQSWQAGTFLASDPVTFITSTYNAAEESPIPSQASTVPGIPTTAGDYIVTAFFSMWNNSQNIPAWINRPSPWLQTTNQESTGNYNSQYQVRRAFNPGTTSGTCPSANFTINDTVSRKVIWGTYRINPSYEARSGQGVAGPSRLGAQASGTHKGTGSSAAKLGPAARASGTAARQGSSRAPVGLSTRGAGAKRGSGVGKIQGVEVGTAGSGRKRAITAGQAPPVRLGAYATKPTEIPVFSGRPPEPTPLPMNQSRYLVQNILTKEWLHTDLPLIDDQVKITLSGPCEISGKIAPELAELKDAQGYPLLRSWGNIIYFELDGEIRAAALITEDSYEDQSQTLVARGVSVYPNAIPYEHNYSVIQTDPLVVATYLWSYVQSRPNSNIGVTTSRMGTAVPESQYVGNEMKSKTTGNPANPGEYIPVADRVYTPYEINWWDRKYCGSLINDMVKAATADYVEQYSWNSDHSDVQKNVLFAYPRIGRRRDDLAFVQGENIVSEPTIASDPDSWATGIMGVGAGEGSAAVRESYETIVPGRLRKINVYYNQRITDKSQMKLLVNQAYNRAIAGGYEVGSIIVEASHENAPYGSYIVGDDIPVDIYVPAYGAFRLWSRIISINLAREDDLVEIELKRSDGFYYGKEVESS